MICPYYVTYKYTISDLAPTNLAVSFWNLVAHFLRRKLKIHFNLQIP